MTLSQATHEAITAQVRESVDQAARSSRPNAVAVARVMGRALLSITAACDYRRHNQAGIDTINAAARACVVAGNEAGQVRALAQFHDWDVGSKAYIAEAAAQFECRFDAAVVGEQREAA